MRVDEFDYELPAELIAQHPITPRDASRMLLLDRQTGECRDACFRELPQILRNGDLLVLNNTRVIPARLFGYRLGLHAHPQPGKKNPARHDFLKTRVEVLLTRQLSPDTWEALVRPGRKLPVGECIHFEAAETADQPDAALTLEAEIIGRGEFGERHLRFCGVSGAAFFEALEILGHIPLPPYIRRRRGAPDLAADRERYQTVYANTPGSVAAPTAGLHFTEDVFRQLDQRGIERIEITLDVGLGTFQPVHTTDVEAHRMHFERFNISQAAADTIERVRREHRRVIAVGTTAVRALETSAERNCGKVAPSSQETDLFLYPGKRFHVIDGLLTNFHLPRSTLLMLVCAFAGKENALRAYRHAVECRYRFLSYGDCMLIQ